MCLARLQKKIDTIHAAGLMRSLSIMDKDPSLPGMVVVDDKTLINFSGNDYLGLSHHPFINQSTIEVISKYGVGSGSSAWISGYSPLQEELEHAFTQWLGVERALLFNNGYMANLGVLTSLLDRHSLVYSDKLIHASLLDGIKLSSAKHIRYQHLDTDHLSFLCDKQNPDLIVTEHVFSMDGDVAPVNDLLDIAERHQSGLMIDDAHGIGVLGVRGQGVIHSLRNITNHQTCYVLPLGKAFNSVGAMVAGHRFLINGIAQLARTHRYTTALPPLICASLLSALRIIMDEEWRRARLSCLIKFFTQRANELSINLYANHKTPIQPILIQDIGKLMAIQHELANEGFYVHAVRPPTVPANASRLRISLSCHHTEDMINDLLLAIKKCMNRVVP